MAPRRLVVLAGILFAALALFLLLNIGGWGAFVGLGIGFELVALVILLIFFRRRGWF